MESFLDFPNPLTALLQTTDLVLPLKVSQALLRQDAHPLLADPVSIPAPRLWADTYPFALRVILY